MPSATKRVAARVAELRHERGMTQETLAAKAGINRVTLARLERAEHPRTSKPWSRSQAPSASPLRTSYGDPARVRDRLAQ